VARGVFLHREDSRYDDVPTERYQFPRQYLSRASQFVGDWIIYYEPRRGPSAKGYFAIARVERIVPDPTMSDMFIAVIDPPSFLRFERAIPFSGESGVVEHGLLNEAGRISGRAQAAVRLISTGDFNRIVDLGLAAEVPLLPRWEVPSEEIAAAFREEHATFLHTDRDRVSYYSSRPVRDRVFRRIVLEAYDCRCAVTGLKFINGGGRAEVEAAHIKPVEHNGPDDPRNGIALSGTAHWMFDRGLISLSDELDVLFSRQVNDPDSVRRLVNSSGRAHEPANPALRPHPLYLAWHREHCFKQ